ncbi:hypothetical protein GE09DRAFT_1050392 [Coniochaeta sp. 2T2.1]|nr:hypothetical protein GE09DRAFT_1050392 [Coniochaeta sp. 2T2.1]
MAESHFKDDPSLTKRDLRADDKKIISVGLATGEIWKAYNETGVLPKESFEDFCKILRTGCWDVSSRSCLSHFDLVISKIVYAFGNHRKVTGRVVWLLLLWHIWTAWNVAYLMAIKDIFVANQDYIGFEPRPERVPSGVVILLWWVVTKFFSVGPVFYMWWTQHGFVLPPPVTKAIMISTKEMACLATGRPQDLDFARLVLAVSQLDRTRFRSCGRCGDFPLGDRVYHCHAYDRHYPLYDHYCGWLWVIVFSKTIKPFLLFQVGLAMDGLYTMIVSLYWASAAPTVGRRLLYGVQAGVVAVLLTVGVGLVAAWHLVAWRSKHGRLRDATSPVVAEPHSINWTSICTLQPLVPIYTILATSPPSSDLGTTDCIIQQAPVTSIDWTHDTSIARIQLCTRQSTGHRFARDFPSSVTPPGRPLTRRYAKTA